MKAASRGPFERIRWFCFDGSILPPKEGACVEHGGGVQHGEWNARTRAIREQGYLIANLLTDLNTLKFVGAYPQLDVLRQVLLEQFLILNDDGWVFRQARFYRGALQVEDERAAARLLLLAMVQDPDWLDPARYLLLREAARLLPVGTEPPTAATVRQLAIEIADADPDFQTLRVKMHGLPDASDPQRVRDYAARQGLSKLSGQYRRLAAELDTLYAPRTAVLQLEALISESGSKPIAPILNEIIAGLRDAPDLQARLRSAAEAALELRRLMPQATRFSPPNQVRLLQANLALEQEVYAVANQLLEQMPAVDRLTRLQWLRSLAVSLQACGFLSDRQWGYLDERLGALEASNMHGTEDYYSTLSYLARVPQWAQRALEFHFETTVEQLARSDAVGGALRPGPAAWQSAACLYARAGCPDAGCCPAGRHPAIPVRSQARRRTARAQSRPAARRAACRAAGRRGLPQGRNLSVAFDHAGITTDCRYSYTRRGQLAVARAIAGAQSRYPECRGGRPAGRANPAAHRRACRACGQPAWHGADHCRRPALGQDLRPRGAGCRCGDPAGPAEARSCIYRPAAAEGHPCHGFRTHRRSQGRQSR